MPPKRLTQAQVDEAVKITAAGVGCRAVARAFNVSKSCINQYLNTPEAREKLALLREHIKHTLMERTAEELIGGAARVAQAKAEEGDAKGLDAATRAMLNLEKASASAAGENRKVEVSGPAGQPLQVDVRAIIGQLLAHTQEGT